MKNLSVSYIIILVICAVFVAALIGFATAGESAPTKPPLTTVQTQPTEPATTVPTGPVLTEPEDLVTRNDLGLMYSHWIRPNGQISRKFELIADAEINKRVEWPEISFGIKLPDSFYHESLYHKNWRLSNYEENGLEVSYYYFVVSTIDGDPCLIAFDLEKGFLLMDWKDGQDMRLVASADPRVDPNYLLEYFSEVIKWYGYDT